MTADSNVHDLGAFLREVLCLGQMRVLYMLHTVLQHFAPFPFPSYHSLTIPYPTTRDLRTAECPKIPPSQRSELPAPTLLPWKHMHRNRVPQTCQICSACPAQPWAWASLKFSRWKFTKSTCAPTAPDCTDRAFSLLLMKVSPLSAAMVAAATAGEAQVQDVLLQVKEQKTHLKHLQCYSISLTLGCYLQNKVGWLDLQARNFGYSELLS